MGVHFATTWSLTQSRHARRLQQSPDIVAERQALCRALIWPILSFPTPALLVLASPATDAQVKEAAMNTALRITASGLQRRGGAPTEVVA